MCTGNNLSNLRNLNRIPDFFMSKVSVKGKTTIPSSVPKALGLGPGDLIQCVIKDDRVVLKKFSLDEVLFKVHGKTFK